jgi:hypothetical protein
LPGVHLPITLATAFSSAVAGRYSRGMQVFEHLVQINDPLMPLLDALTRDQLWQGLVLRAEQPTRFVLGLAGSQLLGREDRPGRTTLRRALDFGSFEVTDRVELAPQQRTQTHTAAGPTWPASRLTITIEEPAPGQLFLRFLYEFDSDSVADDDPQADALRRQAYLSADLDTVARIRELAANGELG